MATVSIAIDAVNNAPVAEGDNAIVANLGMVTIDVIDNDTDEETVDGNTIEIVSPPSSGSAAVIDGQVAYEHTDTDELQDSFTYTITDAAGKVSNVATVSIAIDAVNNAPVAEGDNAIVANLGMVTIDVIDNDTDEETIDGSTIEICLLYTSPSPRDKRQSRMPSSA